MRNSKTFLLIIILAMTSFSGLADEFVRTIGPGSFGNLYALAINPVNPEKIITAIDMGIAYRTENGGATWMLCGGAILNNTNPAYRGGLSALYDSHNPETVYMGAIHGLYRSDNGGKSWRMMQGGEPRWSLNALASDPANSDVIYAASGYGDRTTGWWSNGIGRSRDRGVTFEWLPRPGGDIQHDPVGVRGYTRIIVARGVPGAKGQIFLCGPGGFFRSDDSGTHWLDLEPRIPYSATFRRLRNRSIVADIALLQNGTLLLARCPGIVDGQNTGGLFISSDMGNTWQEWQYSFAPPPDSGPGCKIGTNGDPRQIYLGTSYAVFGTADGGKRWKCLTDPRVSFGRFKYADGIYGEEHFPRSGGNFKAEEVGIWNIHNVCVSSKNPDIVYVSDGNGLFCTHDGGKRWVRLFLCYGRKVQKPFCDRVSIDVPSPWINSKVACGDSQLVVPNTVAIDPFVPSRIAVGFHDIGLNISDDNGQSWRWGHNGITGPEKRQINAVVFDPNVKGRLYAGANRKSAGDTYRIFRSDDSGYTFTAVVIPFLADRSQEKNREWVIKISQIFLDGEKIYVASSEGVFVRDSEHGPWQELHAFRNCDVTRMTKLRNNTIFVAVRTALKPAQGGLYCSTDGGKSFMRIAPDLLGGIASFSVCSSNEDVMVVAARRPGFFRTVWEPHQLYKSTNGGKSWKQISAFRTATAAVDPKDPNKIYLAAWAQDIRQEPCGLFVSYDGGKHFDPLAPEIPVALECREGCEFQFNPMNPMLYYFSSSAGLYEFRKTAYRKETTQ